MTPEGRLLAIGLTGIDQGLYRIDGPKFESIGKVPGQYSQLDVARQGGAVSFTHSTITEPTQVYMLANRDASRRTFPQSTTPDP